MKPVAFGSHTSALRKIRYSPPPHSISPKQPFHRLAHELFEEMRSADALDILVSFIKWSGLRLLIPAFEDLRGRHVPVRLITTSYMGASDAPAVEWPARMPNVDVRVSYDTERTRLHAKAYHFKRNTGFSTACTILKTEGPLPHRG